MERANTPEQCREKAEECRRRADAAIDPRERARWVERANLWEKTAAELEAGKDE